jgi:hypothetical protein
MQGENAYNKGENLKGEKMLTNVTVWKRNNRKLNVKLEQLCNSCATIVNLASWFIYLDVFCFLRVFDVFTVSGLHTLSLFVDSRTTRKAISFMSGVCFLLVFLAIIST